MNANDATKEKMRRICQREGVEVPSCCDPDVSTTVDDVVDFCAKMNIPLYGFFNDIIFRNLDPD